MANLQITAGRINSADSYMDVFGSCGGNSDAETEHLKRTYRQLVRVVHPDKHTGTDQLAIASQAFKKLVEWKKQADQAIKQGTYGQVPTVELVTSQFTHQIRRVVYSGDIADLSMSWTSKGKGTRTCTWFKRARAPSDNDLLEAEVRALERLRAVNTNRDFWPFFPELMESILLSEGKTRRRANVLSRREGFYSLGQLSQIFTDGLNPLDLAWIWRRIVYALGYVHDHGVVHGALVPEHIIVHPKKHGVILIDWAYSSVGFGNYRPALKAIPPAYRTWYPEYILRRESPRVSLDLILAARSMLQLLGADALTISSFPENTPEAMQQYFRQIIQEPVREDAASAFDLLGRFDDLLQSLGSPYYPRRYRELHIPPGM